MTATNASRVKMVDRQAKRYNRFTYLTVIENVKVKPKGTKFPESQRISLVVFLVQLRKVGVRSGR